MNPAGVVIGAPAILLRAESAAVLLCAGLAYRVTGGSWTMLAVLFLAPDLSMAGYLAGKRIGARLYNAAHTYLGPAALLIAGFAAGAPLASRIGLIWAAHIGLDRVLGFGLKYPDGFGHTHLGGLGKPRNTD